MEISFTSDILNEVAEDLGVPLSQVTYCYDLMMRRLDHLISETDEVAIRVIHLGTLTANKFALISQLNHLKENYPDVEDKIAILEKKIEKIDSLADYYSNRNRGDIHLKPSSTRKSWFSFKKSLQELELLQNEEI